jgi:protein disulfide isomerase family A protein 3
LQLNPSRVKYVRNRVLKVASEVEGELSFAVANRDEHAADIQQVGVASASEPSLTIALLF